jgi:hypothetical protein
LFDNGGMNYSLFVNENDAETAEQAVQIAKVTGSFCFRDYKPGARGRLVRPRNVEFVDGWSGTCKCYRHHIR